MRLWFLMSCTYVTDFNSVKERFYKVLFLTMFSFLVFSLVCYVNMDCSCYNVKEFIFVTFGIHHSYVIVYG